MNTQEDRGLEGAMRFRDVDIRALSRRFRGETGENKVPRTVEGPAREMLQRFGNRPEIRALDKDVRARFFAMRGRGSGRLNAPRSPFFTAGVGGFIKESARVALFFLIGAGIAVATGLVTIAGLMAFLS